MDTIFALASARGKSGVAVIRVSGPKAFAAGRALAGRLPEKRMSGLRRLTDAEGAPIDEALVLCFGAEGSFTGEDVVEFQCHGSPAIVARLLDILGGLSGLRPAEPGEFTRRALENDRLDLARVEGLADLIEAETEAQRLQAFRVFDGALGAKVAEWRVDLVRALALIEATIDFADEEVPENVLPEVDALTAKVLASLREEHQGARLAERVREGFEVAILGPPNIGKSTLLNRLAGREAAITSEIAGTTRDVIEVRMDLDGLPVTFLDTAGLRETEDVVEAMGVARARERAASADLRIYLVDGALTETPEPEDIVVQGKSDLTGEGISGLTGDGVGDLVVRVSELLSRRMSGAPVAIKARHRLAIEEGIHRIEAARARLGEDDLVDLLAEDLRSAVLALESLVGLVDVEHLLDEIFSSFCIGK